MMFIERLRWVFPEDSNRRGTSMQTVRASKPIRSGRRPKTKALGRVCAASGCSTVLSRYNVRQTCHPHSPTRFPRVRGKAAS